MRVSVFTAGGVARVHFVGLVVVGVEGFAGEDVAEAWEAQEDELPGEEERALRLLQRRFRSGGEEEQRLLRFLWQRGFIHMC